jgi:hypothetical protein
VRCVGAVSRLPLGFSRSTVVGSLDRKCNGTFDRARAGLARKPPAVPMTRVVGARFTCVRLARAVGFVELEMQEAGLAGVEETQSVPAGFDGGKGENHAIHQHQSKTMRPPNSTFPLMLSPPEIPSCNKRRRLVCSGVPKPCAQLSQGSVSKRSLTRST